VGAPPAIHDRWGWIRCLRDGTVEAVGVTRIAKASLPRRCLAMTADTAALVTMFLPLARRYRSVTGLAHIAIPATMQMAYFTISVGAIGRSPGQLVAGLRVVDVATGERPDWVKSAERWAVWAAPGIVARSVVLASRRLTKKTSAALGEEVQRIASEFDDQPEELHRQLLALHSGRKAAAIWAPGAVTAGLLVIYEITVGRGAQDRVTGTRIVRASERVS